MGSLGKWWVSFKRTHQRTLWALVWKNPVGSLIIWSKCAHHVPEPLIKTSFTKYPAICPYCTQPYTQWVLWEFVVKLSQIESFFWKVLNEPTGYVLGKSLSTFWKNSSWVAQFQSGYILNKIVKELWGFFQGVAQGYMSGLFWSKFKTYPVIPSRSKWWVHWEFAHHLPTG